MQGLHWTPKAAMTRTDPDQAMTQTAWQLVLSEPLEVASAWV